MLKYFQGSLIFTALGLIAGAFIGYETGGGAGAIATSVFICAVLAILEVSLSFDNAVVNASVLQEMDAIWRHRFITWGILIAVFGMRIVFPVVIVAVIAWIPPWDAVIMAATDQKHYAEIIESAHVTVSAFGGAFLAMVGLKHFFDEEKEVHWIGLIERPLARLGKIESVAIGIVLMLIYGVSTQLHEHEQIAFLIAGIMGLVVYVAVDGIGALMDAESATEGAARSGLAAFLYLEVLDASFSFDGVIGAFALTTNLLIIAIGLGIGAMFVRSLTILLVEKGTLTEYRYLEHGAFYAITALGVIMFIKTFYEVPEAVTGLIGAAFIAVSFWSSLQYNRKNAAPEEPIEPRHLGQ